MAKHGRSIVKNNLKICYWNIGGINTHNMNKLEDHLFVQEIKEYDVVILAETHIGYDVNLHVEGFNYFPVCRNISTNGRYYGGLGIFRRTSLKDHIKIIPGLSKDFQWIKFEKQFFCLQNDIYLCAAYVPPANSSYTKKLDFDIIDQIEKDIVSYKSKGDILFCGDLNARTSTEEDYIAQDSSRYLPLFESYKPDNQIRFRKNCDETLDSRGKEIIDLCISNQMRVVNGRCMGDLLGHFTCFNTHGQSTVDYLIANERLFNQILYFRVSEFVSTFSDCHCKISWEILAKYQITETQSNNLHAAPVNFRWTEDSPLKFQQQALLSPDNQQKISSFLINDSDCSSEDINKKAQDLCDIFLSAAKISLVTPKKNKKGSRPQKKWFDSDLFKMRKNVISLGKIYSRYPKDPVIKGRYYKYFRIYNKCRKVKYKQFINSMLQKLDTLRVENPKQYWKLINDIQDSKKENCSSQIDSDTWANHFRNLHSAIDNTFYSRLNQLEMILNDKEKF
ncbi:Hypothetical predicted protein [Mytilus galloprovincialis]|uniref:Endonuclease/exonuclease/phosphatase domain-containing protein n=1 Tax=Mytilus galloprovincialis TaxID=29158 RepID=A0A8B6HAH5_MYTGA|nr:Hypothetical predicted protein [Mytilus galloprovincialis]